jgi:hypothetical protein
MGVSAHGSAKPIPDRAPRDVGILTTVFVIFRVPRFAVFHHTTHPEQIGETKVVRFPGE